MTKKLLSLLAACSLLAGCSTFSKRNKGEMLLNETQIKQALSNAKPPQQFGFSVYPIGNDIAMNGSARLHPRHMATADFENTTSPVINITGSSSRTDMMALIDTSMRESWMEYDTAKKFKATFLGLDGRTIPYRGNLNIGAAPAYAAVVSQMRINQLFIEDTPIFVRMAANSIGPLSRGIQRPNINAVIGYDVLKNFEYIRFNLKKGTVDFSATTPYTPSETSLIGTAGIVKVPGVGLAVEGTVDSQKTPIVLDFAGNYFLSRNDVAVNFTRVSSLGEVVFVNQPTIPGMSPDGLPRAGLRMLSSYIVTVCPRTGVVYFERPGS